MDLRHLARWRNKGIKDAILKKPPQDQHYWANTEDGQVQRSLPLSLHAAYMGGYEQGTKGVIYSFSTDDQGRIVLYLVPTDPSEDVAYRVFAAPDLRYLGALEKRGFLFLAYVPGAKHPIPDRIFAFRADAAIRLWYWEREKKAEREYAEQLVAEQKRRAFEKYLETPVGDVPSKYLADLLEWTVTNAPTERLEALKREITERLT